MGIPIDDNSGLPLITTKAPEKRLEDIILSDQNADKLSGIIEQNRRQDRLMDYHLTPANRLLFIGQPWCGKKMMAEVIAYELGVPLVIINPECVISDSVGDTVINLARVFSYLYTMPNHKVVLIPRMDRYLEYERVFGVLLHHLKAERRSKNVFIGTAIRWEAPSDIGWRDQIAEVMLRFEAPNQQQIHALLKPRTRGLPRHADLVFDSNLVEMFSGMSYGDIAMVIFMAYRQMVTSGEKELEKQHIDEAHTLYGEVIDITPRMMREGVRW